MTALGHGFRPLDLVLNGSCVYESSCLDFFCYVFIQSSVGALSSDFEQMTPLRQQELTAVLLGYLKQSQASGRSRRGSACLSCGLKIAILCVCERLSVLTSLFCTSLSQAQPVGPSPAASVFGLKRALANSLSTWTTKTCLHSTTHLEV